MKQSKYNFFVDLPQNRVIIAFNAFTLSLVEFSLSDRRFITDILKNPDRHLHPRGKPAKIRETLAKGGFLIEDDTNELQILKVNNRIARFKETDLLSLTIAPTLACNFRCSYCYETHANLKMTPIIQESLVGWAKKECENGKSISVTWFGGEPLLALREVSYLSEHFLKLAAQHNRSYDAFMVTNGYLLKRKTAETLKTLGVNKVQITLDGPPAIHNQRRPLVNKKGTFEAILSNLKETCDLFQIDLRINIDKNNAPFVLDVLDILEKEGLKNKVYPYFGFVYPYTKFCGDIKRSCFQKQEFSLLEARLKLEMIKRGFAVSTYPRPKRAYCGADSYFSQVIGPDGAFVKCWDSLCDQEGSVGHLLPERRYPQMQANSYKWLSWDPFEKTKCCACKILPLCMGGCLLVAFQKNLKDRGECVGWRYNLKEMISLYYLQKKRAEEAEIARALSAEIEKLKDE